MMLVHRTVPTTAWNNDVAKNYRWQTSFSSMVDGLSFQAFFGEKSVHPRVLLTCDSRRPRLAGWRLHRLHVCREHRPGRWLSALQSAFVAA